MAFTTHFHLSTNRLRTLTQAVRDGTEFPLVMNAALKEGMFTRLHMWLSEVFGLHLRNKQANIRNITQGLWNLKIAIERGYVTDIEDQASELNREFENLDGLNAKPVYAYSLIRDKSNLSYNCTLWCQSDWVVVESSEQAYWVEIGMVEALASLPANAKLDAYPSKLGRVESAISRDDLIDEEANL